MGNKRRSTRQGSVGFRLAAFAVVVFYTMLLLVYARFGYKHCRAAELADDYLRAHGPLLPPDAVANLPAENGTVVVTVASRPWCLGTLNWVVAARRAGLRRVVVVNLGPGELLCDAVHALDLGAVCLTVAPRLQQQAAVHKSTVNFGESAFFDLMTVRTAVLYELLRARHDRDVLFSDADVIMLQNPLPTLIARVREKSLDLLAQRDYGKLFDLFFDPICAGFMYFHNTEKTRTFWRSVLSFVLQHPSRNDQKAVNMCGRDPALGLAYDTLDPDQFPDGYRYFFQNNGLVPADDDDEDGTSKHNQQQQQQQQQREEFTFVEPPSAENAATTATSPAAPTTAEGKSSSKQQVRLRRDLSKKYLVHTNWLLSEKKIAKMMGEGLWFLPPELSQLCGTLE